MGGGLVLQMGRLRLWEALGSGTAGVRLVFSASGRCAWVDGDLRPQDGNGFPPVA